MSNVKQVIVMRKDLNMRKGKIAAQAAHASMAALLKAGHIDPGFNDDNERVNATFLLIMEPDSAIDQWLRGSFTKICVYVNSEQELLDVVAKAREHGVLNALITDNGVTEFHRVPTITCAAIGPDFVERISPITGHLPLL